MFLKMKSAQLLLIFNLALSHYLKWVHFHITICLKQWNVTHIYLLIFGLLSFFVHFSLATLWGSGTWSSALHLVSWEGSNLKKWIKNINPWWSAYTNHECLKSITIKYVQLGNTCLVSNKKLMGLCKKDVTPLLTHWSYIFFALSHRNDATWHCQKI